MLATSDWFAYDGRPYDAWRFSGLGAEDDVEDRLKLNFERRMFLARYGKQSVLQWDQVPLTDVIRYVNALVELLEKESADRKVNEDQ